MELQISQTGPSDRFEVLSEIGRGAGSRVLKAHDRWQDAPRALKVATRRRQLRKYRLEYQRLSQFRHPHIVRAFDFGTTDDGYPFYSMELVEGVSLGHFQSRHDPQTLAVLAMQVLDSLAMIHARGWVHRDIKPKNLLIVGEGPAALARLIDFGLLGVVGKESRVTGTLPYLAPEVARGEVIDGRADLFSLGMVLYEALMPDDMASTVEDVARQLFTQPPPPARVNPVIPGGLSDFVVRLIQPDPEDRFPDAVAAAETLSRLPGLRLGRGPARAAAERLLRGGAVSHRTTLVRRVRRLAAAVKEEDRGGLVLLQGNIGVGKTPLLRELNVVLNVDGFRVVRLRTTHRSGSPMTSLLRIARAMDPSAGELPALIDVGSDQWRRKGELSRYAGRVGVALAAALGGRPTVLMIDDLQRAEPVALAVLRSLAGELAQVPLFVVCAADLRFDGEGLATALGGLAEKLEVAPLRRREVAALVRHRLVGLALPRPALERLVEDSEGMPSLVERTLARLIVDETIQRDGAQYTFVGGRYRAARYLDNELLYARIARVTDSQRDVLAAAAVLGWNVSAASVAEVLALPTGPVGATLGELERLEILAPGESTADPEYTFASADLLSTVYQRIPQEARRRYHDRAADVLARASETRGRVEERVEHLLRGGDDQRAVAAAIEAGDRAAAVYADRRAVEYYGRAFARLRGAPDKRAAFIALRLGRVFERSGELDRAAVWYQTATSSAELPVRVEATIGQGAVAYVQGLSAETERHMRVALDWLKEWPDPRFRAMAHRLLALVAIQRGENEGVEAMLLHTLRELREVDAELGGIEVLLDLARFCRERGEIVKAVRYARKAQRRAKEAGDFAGLAEASTVLGRGFLQAGRFSAARRALLRGLRVARASGDRLRQGLVLREIGNLRMREGDLAGALERYEKSLELVRASGARADESAALHNIGMAHTRLGDFRPALNAFQAALDVTHGIGDVWGAALTAVEMGHAYAWMGDLKRAHQMLGSALDPGRALLDPVIDAEGRALLAWVAVRSGGFMAGQRFLGELDRLLEPVEDPDSRGLALLYATRIAIGIGESHKATRLGERLKQVVAQGALGAQEPAATGVRGQAAALAGERDAAVTLLTRAIFSAAEMQLRPLLVDFRASLAAVLEGTTQEAEQITLAMEGMREIVQDLPEESASVYLSTPEAGQIRQRFRNVYQRLMGGLAPMGPATDLGRESW